jgi:hypothetical protein
MSATVATMSSNRRCHACEFLPGILRHADWVEAPKQIDPGAAASGSIEFFDSENRNPPSRQPTLAE